MLIGSCTMRQICLLVDILGHVTFLVLLPMYNGLSIYIYYLILLYTYVHIHTLITHTAMGRGWGNQNKRQLHVAQILVILGLDDVKAFFS